MNASKSIRHACQLVLCFFSTATVFAQSGLQDMSYTAATTALDAARRHWAYLVWDATTPSVVAGKQFALYRKTGDALSPALYERVALVQRQTDPRVIAALLNRAVHLGENTNELNAGITELFQKMTNAMALPLPEKISAILRGSAGHAVFESNLRLMAKVHPALAMCLGQGHTEMIPGPAGAKSTFEIREFDAVRGRDLGVVGRVTVAAGQPTVLPAPGAPVQVPENNPKGHLNAKFRWATSADLRRLSLLNYGFNLWRMTKTFAEAGGYPNNPPAPAALSNLAMLHPNDVRLVNHMPVLPGKSFDDASAGNFLTDASTIFITDDNGRFDGRPPFNNGDQYYYFVTARDLLGQDGLVSRGTRVTLCNRLPPSPPKGLRVENDYAYTNGTGQQVFKLSWKPNVNTAEDRATAYYVYRWNSQTQMLVFDAVGDFLTNRIAGPIPHMAGVTQLCVLDNGPGAPAMPADADQTYWYTVRAAETNACGTNFSPSSTFVYGVLRDRVGPAAPTGYVELNCPNPFIAVNDTDGVNEPGQNPQRAYFRARASRVHPFLQWAEFTVRVRKQGVISQNPLVVGPVEETNQLGRVEFNASNRAEVDFDLPRTNLISVTFEARSVLANGAVSATAISSPLTPLPPGTRLVGWFYANVTFTQPVLSTPTAVRITQIILGTGGVVNNYPVTLVITLASSSSAACWRPSIL